MKPFTRLLTLAAIVLLSSACEWDITGLGDTIEIPVDSMVVRGAVTEDRGRIDSGRAKVELRADSAIGSGLMAVDHVDQVNYRVAATCGAGWIRFVHPDGREAWVQLFPPCGDKSVDYDFAQGGQ